MEEQKSELDCEKKVYEVTRNMTVEQLEAVVVVLNIITQNIQRPGMNETDLMKTLNRIFDKAAEEWYIEKEGRASAAINERARLG